MTQLSKHFDRIEAGRYELKVEAAGFANATLEFEVLPGEVTVASVKLLDNKTLLLRQLLDIGPINFATGKSTIKMDSYQRLQKVIKIMNANPKITKLKIEGHTDSVGKRTKNLRLSQARAQAVKTFLVARGIAAKRLSSEGYGPDRPVADNKTPAGKAENRRVEFVLEDYD